MKMYVELSKEEMEMIMALRVVNEFDKTVEAEIARIQNQVKQDIENFETDSSFEDECKRMREEYEAACKRMREDYETACRELHNYVTRPI